MMDKQKIDDILLRARTLIRVGRKADAHHLLRALLNQERDVVEGWELMVRVARSQEEAAFCLQHVLRLKPGDPWAVNTLLKLRDIHPERGEDLPAPRRPRRLPDPAPDPAQESRITEHGDGSYVIETVSFLDDEDEELAHPIHSMPPDIETVEEAPPTLPPEPPTIDTVEEAPPTLPPKPEVTAPEDDPPADLSPEELLDHLDARAAELTRQPEDDPPTIDPLLEAAIFFDDTPELDELETLLDESLSTEDTPDLPNLRDENADWVEGLPSEPRYPIPDWDTITDTYPRPELVEKAGKPLVGRIALITVLVIALVALVGTLVFFLRGVFAPAAPPAIGDAHVTVKNAPVDRGASLTDTIEDAFNAHNYIIEASEGQTISVRVEGIDGANPEVFIYAPDGQTLLGSDDDSGGGLDAELSVSVAKEGAYIIRVRLWEPGAYTIAIR